MNGLGHNILGIRTRGYFLWDILKDTVYTTKGMQQVMCAVLTKVSEEL
jgi:hypothetical protein